MRIALIVPGGVDRSARVRVIPVLLALIERLAKRNRVLVVAINQEPQACDYPLLGAHVVNLGALPEGRVINWGIRLVRLLSTLRSFGGGFDILHAFWAHPTGSLAIAAGALLDVPVVVSVGGGELARLPEISYGGQLASRTRIPILAALRTATVVSAPSSFALQPLQKLRPDALWLPLGVTNRFFQDPIPNQNGGKKRLLHVASLSRVKDQITLMKAIRKVWDAVSDVRLDCIGVDTLGGQVQHFADALGISDVVRFHGVLPVDELLPFYGQADVYVQSSLHESMGAAVLEASAAGVPVVGTGVGLVREMSPRAAVAVPPKDADSLAQAILALSTNEEKRVQIGQAARKFARTYDADWSSRAWEDVYRQAGRRSMPFALSPTQIKIEPPELPFR
jgi:glycosyltransferase involved in cell wall biosynthesis